MTTCSTYKTFVALPPSFSAVYNYFKEDSEYKLKLTVGDAVHLLCECEEWYFGSTIENRHVCGIFPKSYVHVRECVVDDTGPVPVFILKQPPIVQEITTVLREWGTHWKNLYVVSKSIKCIIFRQIVSKYIEKFAFAFPKLIRKNSYYFYYEIPRMSRSRGVCPLSSNHRPVLVAIQETKT